MWDWRPLRTAGLYPGDEKERQGHSTIAGLSAKIQPRAQRSIFHEAESI